MNERLTAMMTPQEEADWRVDTARLVQRTADEEVGKRTGEPEDENTPRPHVWVIVDEDMRRFRRFTGKEGFRGASPEARKYLEAALRKIEEYIMAPHIVDDFETHAHREAWQEKHFGARKDVMTFLGKSKLSLNLIFQLQRAFMTIAKGTADLNCEEARYIREVVQNIGKTDEDGEPIGLPDVVEMYSGNEEETGTVGRITEEDKVALAAMLKALQEGTFNVQPAAPQRKKNLRYDAMEPEKKWDIGYEYLQVAKKLLEKIEASEAELAARRASIRPV
jgi:hypothetical protein